MESGSKAGEAAAPPSPPIPAAGLCGLSRGSSPRGSTNTRTQGKERLRASTPLPYSKCCLDPQVIAETGYPMTWTEIHGDVYHPLVWHFRGQGHIDNGLPGYSSKSWI